MLRRIQPRCEQANLISCMHHIHCSLIDIWQFQNTPDRIFLLRWTSPTLNRVVHLCHLYSTPQVCSPETHINCPNVPCILCTREMQTGLFLLSQGLIPKKSAHQRHSLTLHSPPTRTKLVFTYNFKPNYTFPSSCCPWFWNLFSLM